MTALKRRLDSTFARMGSLPDADFESKSDFARYLCVLVSGFVETALAELAIEYCRKRSVPQVTNYATSQLGRIQNVKAERLLQLMGSFEPSWRVEMENFIEGPRKDALDSVVDLRNKIAHGESVGVTYARITDYYQRILQIVEFVAEKLD